MCNKANAHCTIVLAVIQFRIKDFLDINFKLLYSRVKWIIMVME